MKEIEELIKLAESEGKHFDKFEHFLEWCITRNIEEEIKRHYNLSWRHIFSND